MAKLPIDRMEDILGKIITLYFILIHDGKKLYLPRTRSIRKDIILFFNPIPVGLFLSNISWGGGVTPPP